MEDYFAKQALTGLSGKKYAQSEAPENISEASSAPREEVEDVGGKAKGVKSHPKSRTQALQAMGVVRGCLALGPAVPGVDVMAKRSQGWVKCEDRLPYYRNQK
jgi:hypothetical protein